MRALHDCSKNAFDALQKYIFASHFVTQNVTNAFDALQKYIFASHFVTQNVTNAFLQRVHFPKENVQHHIFQRKMFSNATRTFSKGKCSVLFRTTNF